MQIEEDVDNNLREILYCSTGVTMVNDRNLAWSYSEQDRFSLVLISFS